MSFGFGVGDLLASLELLSKTRQTLQQALTFAGPEGQEIIEQLSICLDTAKLLTHVFQNTDSQELLPIILHNLTGLSEAASIFAKDAEHMFKNKNSRWNLMLWTTRKPKLQRDMDRVQQRIQSVQRLVEQTIMFRGLEAARSLPTTTRTREPPEGSIASTLTSPNVSSRVNSMPWAVSMGPPSELERPDIPSILPDSGGDVDIILVPDLGGHVKETWSGCSRTWVSNLISDKALKTTTINFGYHPTSLLAGDFRRALKIEAKRLLDHLTYMTKSRSAVILCHGIGSFLAKTAVIYGAQAAKYDSDYADTLSRLLCIVSFGPPDWMTPGSLNRHLNLLRMTAQAPALRRITLLSAWIAAHPLSISEYAADVELQFLVASESHSVGSITCRENQQTVTNESVLMLSQSPLSTPLIETLILEGNYFTMCQYQSPESANFDRLRDFVTRYVCDHTNYHNERVQTPYLSREKFVPTASATPSDTNKMVPDEKPDPEYILDVDILCFQSIMSAHISKFKQSLEPLTFPIPHYQIHEATTSDWIREATAYKQWIAHSEARQQASESTNEESAHKGLLCIIGEQMTGKSTLLRFIAEKVQPSEFAQDVQIMKLVYTLDENVPDSRRPVTILKSLIWQLLEEHPSTYPSIYHQYQKAPPSFDELGLLFVRLLSTTNVLVLIVIDNLEFAFNGIHDEEGSGPRDLVPLLEIVASMTNIRVLTTYDSRCSKICYEIDASNFVLEQTNAIAYHAQAEMDRRIIDSTHLRTKARMIRDRLCAACRGSFLRVTLGFHLVMSAGSEYGYLNVLEKYETTDTSLLMIEVGLANLNSLRSLAVCIRPVSFDEASIISGFLRVDTGTKVSNFKKFSQELSTLKPSSALDALGSLEGIFFNVKDGLLYPSSRRIAYTLLSAKDNGLVIADLCQRFEDLCVAALTYYTQEVGHEMLKWVVGLHLRDSFPENYIYRAHYPLLAYTMRYWLQYSTEFDEKPGFLVDLLSEWVDLPWISEVILHEREESASTLPYIYELRARKSRDTQYKKLTASLSSAGPQHMIDALTEAGSKQDHLAVREILDAQYQGAQRKHLNALFSVWIQDAIESNETKVVCFPLDVLDSSRGKEPSQLDICFSHEDELHHLFRLAIVNEYWGVAAGIWTALTESETLDFQEWLEEYGNSMLYEAVRKSNYPLVSELIKTLSSKVDDHEFAFPGGVILLHLAAAIGAEDIIDLLIGREIQFESEFNQINTDASEQAEFNKADRTPSEPIQVKRRTALMIAAASGFIDIVRMLINASLEADDSHYVNYVDTNGNTALHHAVLYGHKAIVEDLLLSAAYVEQQDLAGRTPMHMAAAGNWGDLIEVLCRQSASAGIKDKHGLTPLHIAARNGSTHAATRLLGRSPQTVHNRDKKGYTPLHHAVHYGSEATVRLLLDHGAPVNSITKDGNTPVHLAASSLHPSTPLLNLLLEKSQLLQAKNKAGHTPADLATKHNNPLLLERLRMAEAHENNARESSQKTQPSHTPFLAFGAQVDELGESVVAQNLRKGNPDHYLSRAIEDLRKVTESVRGEHGKLGPTSSWNSIGTAYGVGGRGR